MRYEIIWTMGKRGKEVNANKDVDNLVDALKETVYAIVRYDATRFEISAVGKPGERRSVLHAAKIRGKWVVL